MTILDQVTELINAHINFTGGYREAKFLASQIIILVAPEKELEKAINKAAQKRR